MLDWTVKENAQSVSICWYDKVIARISFQQIPKDEAIANFNFMANACNHEGKIALLYQSDYLNHCPKCGCKFTEVSAIL